ncbi:MAG: CDP-alcohol phosphatidyltransferase family protein [Spirochaetes bacterium]|nr:CDP-alcohol phosphatidyltransferase family protein [Spirochaetota bacterium]
MGVKKSIIPNLFTMGNMLMGFVSILFSAKYVSPFGNHDYLLIAGILIFIGALFDASDGAVARALNVESEIGMQLDSFADAVTYGIAPGVLAYQAFLHELPEIYFGISSGVIAAAIFPVCAVYRLARFNIEDGGKGFKGLPSPPAGMIVGIVPAMYSVNVLFVGEVNCEVNVYQYLIFYVIIALLMVSVIDYSKLFSDIWKLGVAARIITIVVIVLLLIFAKAISIFFVTGIYILWGIFKYAALNFFKKGTQLKQNDNCRAV